MLGGKRRMAFDVQINGVKLLPDYNIRRYLGCAVPRCSKSVIIIIVALI
jgi:hypothetical protein